MTTEVTLNKAIEIKKQLLKKVDDSHNVVFKYTSKYVGLLIKLKKGARLYYYEPKHNSLTAISAKNTQLTDLCLNRSLDYVYDNLNVLVIDRDKEVIRTFKHFVKDLVSKFRSMSYNIQYYFSFFTYNKKFITNCVDFVDWNNLQDSVYSDVVDFLSHTSFNDLNFYEKSNLKEIFKMSNNWIRYMITSSRLSYHTLKKIYDKNLSLDLVKENQRSFTALHESYWQPEIIKCYNKCYTDFSLGYAYRDYLNMRNQLPNSLAKDFPLVPKEISRERITYLHDKVMEVRNRFRSQQEEARIKQLNENYIKEFLPKAEQFEYSDDNYSIMACKNLIDLVKEGSALHHCVGSYANSVAKGNEYILFLRKNDDLNTPFYTVDVNPSDKTIRQIHGMCNCNVTEEIANFVKKWAKKFKLDDSHYSGCLCALR